MLPVTLAVPLFFFFPPSAVPQKVHTKPAHRNGKKVKHRKLSDLRAEQAAKRLASETDVRRLLKSVPLNSTNKQIHAALPHLKLDRVAEVMKMLRLEMVQVGDGARWRSLYTEHAAGAAFTQEQGAMHDDEGLDASESALSDMSVESVT
eukprot:6177292-Pleurochrysis_carterae.AAC.1